MELIEQPPAKSFERQRLLLLTVYFCLVATSILVNYPGRLNPDTIDMLWEGQNIGDLNDWHAPFVTFVYTFLSPMFGSPLGALVVQSLLLLGLPALWFVQLVEAETGRLRRAVAWTIWAIVSSTFLVLAGQVVKDELGVCFLSLAGAVAIHRRLRPGSAPLMDQAVIGLCLVAFVLVRPTGILTVSFAAIAYLFTVVNRHDRAVETFKVGVLMIVSAASILFLPPFLRAQKAHPENTVIVFDLAGMSTVLHEDLFASVFPPTEPRQAPWDCYKPQNSDDFFWGKCQEYLPLIDRHQSAVAAAWAHALVRHPIAYLAHRAAFARHLLLTSSWIVPVPPDFTFDVYNTAATPMKSLKEQMSGLGLWKPTISFTPFGQIAYRVLDSPTSTGAIRILLLVLLPILALRLIERHVALVMIVISTFGIANAIVMTFVAPAATARYLLPTWFCVACEIVTLSLAPGCASENCSP